MRLLNARMTLAFRSGRWTRCMPTCLPEGQGCNDAASGVPLDIVPQQAPSETRAAGPLPTMPGPAAWK